MKLLSCLSALLAFAVLGSPAFADAGSIRAAFSVEVDGVTSDLTLLSTTVMPGATLTLTTHARATASAGNLQRERDKWIWTAPSEPGLHRIDFKKDGEQSALNVFVLTPFENGVDTALNGYKIGAYRQSLFKGLPSYAAPTGFIDYTLMPEDTQISPHFTLGQFICKQQPGHEPTYLLIQSATLLKLETLLEAANAKGWAGDTFFIMSGFRTPFYNASIGNKTTSSRHLYGDAADIWLDNDGDGQMDDLNGDGKIDKNDARTLGKLAESLALKGGPNWPKGGIGIYAANAAHGPFVHIDARGYPARWGQ